MDCLPTEPSSSDAQPVIVPPAQKRKTASEISTEPSVPDSQACPLMQWQFAPYHTDEQIANAKQAWEAVVLAFDASRGKSGQPSQPTNVEGETVAHTASAQRPSTVVLVLEQPQSQPQPPAAAGGAARANNETRQEQPQPPAAPGSVSRSQVHYEQPQPPAAPGSAPGAFREVHREQPQPPAAPGSASHTPSRGNGRRPAEPIIIDGSPASPAAACRPPTPGPARRPTTLPIPPRSPAGRAPAHHSSSWRPRARYQPVVNIVNVGRRDPASPKTVQNSASGDSGLPPTDHRSEGTSSPLGMTDDRSQYGSGSMSSGSVHSDVSSPTPSM